jgi:hypothetical protein
MNLTGNHLKAARMLCGVDQERLSALAGVGINTVRNMEAYGDQPIGGYQSTREKVQRALEAIGIEFTNGGEPGVRLRKITSTRQIAKRSKGEASKAADLAAREIEKLSDKIATGEERASRKRRLIAGPKEFRGIRRK